MYKEIREKHFMNILVIGNGFDLAHGLPTKYGDFMAIIIDYCTMEE